MEGKEQRSSILDCDFEVSSCQETVSCSVCRSILDSIPGNVPSLRNLLGVDVQRPTYCTASTRIYLNNLLITYMNLRVRSREKLVLMHSPLTHKFLTQTASPKLHSIDVVTTSVVPPKSQRRDH